jgi:hypothetical protein
MVQNYIIFSGKTNIYDFIRHFAFAVLLFCYKNIENTTIYYKNILKSIIL